MKDEEWNRDMKPLTGRRYRIIIAHNNDLLRLGIHTLLSRLPEVITTGEAGDGPELVKIAQKISFDLLIADFDIPYLSALEAVEKIRIFNPDVKAIIFSVRNDAQLITEARRRKIQGFLLESELKKSLPEAIRKIRAGETFYVKPVNFLKRRPGTPQRYNPIEKLTGKERETLRHIARGLHYAAIAEVMGITIRTVNFHKKNISTKLQANSIAELTQIALTHGLILNDGDS